MKTILFVLLVAFVDLLAQRAPAAEKETTSTPASGGDANRDRLLQQALRQSLADNANVLLAAAGPGEAAQPSSLTPRSAPRPLPPPRTNSIVVPSSPAPAPGTRPESIVVPSAPGAAAEQTNVTARAAAATNPSAPASVTAAAPPATNAPAEEMLQGVIDFPNVDINQVLQFYAQLVGRTVLRPSTLPAPNITLKTQTPLTKKEATDALNAVLGMNGIAMVNVGDKFVKAMPIAQAGQAGAAWNKLDAPFLPELGPYVTHVVQLKYAKPSEVVTVLQPFASAIANPILAIDSSQILVFRDFAENVKRMLEMLKEVDVSIPSEYISEVIPIKYALASDIANALNSLSSGGGATSVGGQATAGGGRMGGISGSGFRGVGGAGYGRSGFGSSYGGYGYPGMGGVTPYAVTTPIGQPGAVPPGGTFSDRLRNIINRAATSGEIQVLGQTKMIADERTNSLLIFASREDMKIIKDIVSKLDVVLAQVLIEAVIIEVNLNDNQNLGVSYLQRRPSSVGDFFKGIGGINNGNALSANNLLSGGTNAAGNFPGGLSYLATLGKNQDLDVTVTALASDSRAKILQRPRIQTSHAVPGQIFIGESRPYPTASYYGGGAYGGYSSIQQLQIGVTLDVTPLINPDGLVVMDIHQTIESANGTVNITGVGEVPITSRKEAAAKVAVRDRDTIILGGLIETSKSKSASGVPLLKDIPVLGYLFRSTSQKEVRNELIVLIRPTVLPTPEIAALTAKAEKDRMPLVRRAESEIQEEEARRIKQAEKREKKKAPEFESFDGQ